MTQFDDQNRERKLKVLREKEEEGLAQVLSSKYNVKYIDLSKVSIDTDALKLIPEEKARKNKIAVFSILNKKLSVAVFSPQDQEALSIIEDLEKKGYSVTVYMVSNKSLDRAWSMYKDISFSTETKAGVLDVSNEQIERMIEETGTLADVIKMIQETLAMKKSYRISRIVETIIAGALSVKASDVHIEPEEKAVRLRFRLNGILTDILDFDTETYLLLLSRIKLLSGLKLNIKEEAQDGRFSIKLGPEDIEIRASSLPGSFGESIVLRVLNPDTIQKSVDTLGMDKDLLMRVEEELRKPNGMILNTGPTGSGKTTTLYAFLRQVKRPAIKIITIEDPVEYRLKGIVQTQVDSKKKYTFSSGLRASLRQDPDIIMVGEVRDKETAKIALNAALTGHLVFSTLHTNSAAGTFPRLVDLEVDPKVIGPAVNLAMAQRLVRVLDEKMKKKVPLEGKDKEDVDRIVSGISDKSKVPQTDYMWVPDVPEGSMETGYVDRIGIFEAVFVNDEIEKLLLQSPREAEIAEVAKKQGFLDIKQDGIVKVLNGITSLEEVRRVVEL